MKSRIHFPSPSNFNITVSILSLHTGLKGCNYAPCFRNGPLGYTSEMELEALRAPSVHYSATFTFAGAFAEAITEAIVLLQSLPKYPD